MTAAGAVTLVLAIILILVWQGFSLSRRITRVEQAVGLRKERPLD